MAEFWEAAFKSKQRMWGEQPTAAALATCAHFKSLGFRKILLPGFGYGRNAQPFLENGFEVTGIEISQHAIELAHQRLGAEIKVFHGSVADMPFDQDLYDGVFCHALIHLLGSAARHHLLAICHAQLQHGGLMVFTTITKHASTYGVGEQLGKDLFKTKDGVELFFYDAESIQEEFGRFGLLEATVVEETPATKFWQVVCEKK